MKSGKISGILLVSLLFLAGICLLSGLYAGLARLGFLNQLSQQPVSPMLHGPLMINGFLGTLISLERAAALDKYWAFSAPFMIAVSTFLLLFGFPVAGKLLLILGSLVLLGVMIYLYVLQPRHHHLIMALGAASLVVGNIFYLFGFGIYELVAWWAAFPVLTIFGERLELNRIMRPPENARKIFVSLILLWIGATIFTHFNRNIGWRIGSLLLIGQSLWLIKYDIARRTVKSVQWTKYSAISLLSGYGWMILVGVYGLWIGFPTAGPLYDGLLHMIFVGFVFSMIFAHASVIIPALSGKVIPYSKYFYLPLILLHGFLIVRIIGDIIWMPMVRKMGSHGNVLAIILFLGGVIFQLIRTSLTKKAPAKS